MDVVTEDQGVVGQTRNRFDRMEFAGAFGDLGTLIPFAVAYIGILKMDPFGVLLSFGLAMVMSGLIYRTCVYQKLKLGRSGDEVRPGWHVT